MSFDKAFTKENLDYYLKELAKEFRKRNGTKMSAEIVLIGGAAVLANYGFREMTYDIDAIIIASSVMKEAINAVGDRLELPNGWLNTDFKNTSSFSLKFHWQRRGLHRAGRKSCTLGICSPCTTEDIRKILWSVCG